MECNIGILWLSVFLGCLGGDYWFLVVVQFLFHEHESCEAFGNYHVGLLHACIDGH